LDEDVTAYVVAAGVEGAVIGEDDVGEIGGSDEVELLFLGSYGKLDGILLDNTAKGHLPSLGCVSHSLQMGSILSVT
jgi:hypothetical protein